MYVIIYWLVSLSVSNGDMKDIILVYLAMCVIRMACEGIVKVFCLNNN